MKCIPMAKNIIIPIGGRKIAIHYMGTRLTRNNQDPVTGYWANNACEWGYVDNMGSDNLVGGNVIDGKWSQTGFK